MNEKKATPVLWMEADGSPISCEEKIKVLDENLEEIKQVCQDAFEDAVLMGCDETKVREIFKSVISKIDNPYSQQGPKKNADNNKPVRC
ncbi:MAG: hypothetical protein VW802_06335 [Rhodospirillaceae bacterium]|jgi:uncharacterized protein (UPF0335 family)